MYTWFVIRTSLAGSPSASAAGGASPAASAQSSARRASGGARRQLTASPRRAPRLQAGGGRAGSDRERPRGGLARRDRDRARRRRERSADLPRPRCRAARREHRFEATAYLLWNGACRTRSSPSCAGASSAGMVVPAEVHDAIRALRPGGLPMDVLRTGLSRGRAARARRGRRAARTPCGRSPPRRRSSRTTPGCAPAAPDRRARSRARDRRELPAQAQRRDARAGAGPRARRVLHPRRRARHERIDVHRARDRLDALRPRPPAWSAPSALSRAPCTAARRATSRT